MSRMLWGGFPCPRKVWEESLKLSDLKVYAFDELLSEANSCDFRVIARIVEKKLMDGRPDTLILHDFGVTVGLYALLKLRKKGESLPAKIILFNGAFRGFNAIQARYPFQIQLMNAIKCKKIVESFGGQFSEWYLDNYGLIRKLYRNVILASFLDAFHRVKSSRYHLPIGAQLNSEILILASKTDPFIPWSAITRLQSDFVTSRMEIHNYGHFPYSSDQNWAKRILNFEAGDRLPKN